MEIVVRQTAARTFRALGLSERSAMEQRNAESRLNSRAEKIRCSCADALRAGTSASIRNLRLFLLLDPPSDLQDFQSGRRLRTWGMTV